jgi:transposase
MPQDSLTAGLYARQQKGLVIAQTKKVRQTRNDLWLVPSQSHPGTYLVDAVEQTCTCPDHEATRGTCKHLHAVTFARLQTVGKDGTVLTTDTVKITYSQNWPAYNRAQCEEKEIVQRLLRGLCDGIVQPPHVRGRPTLALGDVVYGSIMKVYTTVSGRRATTDLRECESKGLIDHAPHYNSISNYLAKPDLTPLLRTLVHESALPLKEVETGFSIDSSGFATSNYARWYDEKYGRERRHQFWVKAHVTFGNRTGIVPDVIVTVPDRHDATQFAELVETTSRQFQVRAVCADKAYISRRNVQTVVDAGGIPYIPFKSNNKGEGPASWERLWDLFNYHRGDFDKAYGLRNRAEAGFSSIKRLMGSALRSKKFDAQVNEVLAKVLCYNLTVLVHQMFELGITPEFLPAPV